VITGQDARALNAVAALWEMYAGADDDSQRNAMMAIRWVVSTMGDGSKPFARELIARSLDWSDRDRLWPVVTAPAGPPPQLRAAPPTDKR